MNQLAETTDRLPMNAVGISSGSTGAKIAPQNLSEVVKFAEVMCRADIALPKHLRGNAGACMAVALQALDWQMNPFAVASKSYSVNGQIAYEAQLIVAVVNTRSGIEGRITYEFEGEGQDRVCIASGKLDGVILSVRSPKLKDITPKNSPLWKSDSDQQQCYYTGRSWARRYTPEVILGVYDRDEVESFTGPENAKDITPQPSVMQRLKAAQATQEPTGEREGFDASFVHSETETALNGEILTDNPESGSSPSSEPVNAEASPLTSAASDDSESSTLSSDAPSSPQQKLFPTDRADMIECCQKLMSIPVDDTLETPQAKRGVLVAAKDNWKAKLPAELHDHIKAFFISADAQIKGNADRDAALSVFADMLDCSVEEIGG
ncbi:hypothetical protein [Rhizobium sp. 11515TR]|uniref:hypothetical protein n=1 Tax=Rhizobium sp. 11515TR TaxID=2028343 RepID=UPI000BA84D96|nr:hypothetical protein [Rhizobium sp. 11515TR]ASW06259.1 hypothetical protein CKA34_10440 [Rhizobium sp. 11515TR]